MLASLTLSFMLVQPSVESSRPTPADAQRAVAEAHVAQRAYEEAGEAYLKLASMSGVVRRDELDQAHVNLDSAYLTSNLTRHLCRALQVAEMTIAEGNFEGEQEEKFWQDIRDDDVRRLREDASATKRQNCRFGTDGESLKVAVALLADPEVEPQILALDLREPASRAGSLAAPVQRGAADRRWRVQTVAGAALVGVGIGSLGLLIGVLEVHRRQAQAMERMNEDAAAVGGFSTAGLVQHDQIYADARITRSAAIGLGVVTAASLSTGVALLVSRKRVTRTVAVYPYGGLHGGGATLRLRF